jgi:hypothetical protein
MAFDSTRCPLLELPTELQLQIFELVLQEDRPLLLGMPCNSSYRGRYQEMREDIISWTSGALRPPVQPALTQTCSTVRAAALPIFYNINIFRVCYCHHGGESIKYAIKWLIQIGPENRMSLKHFYFYDRNEWQDRHQPSILKRLQSEVEGMGMRGELEDLSGNYCCCHRLTFGGKSKNAKDDMVALRDEVPLLRMKDEI